MTTITREWLLQTIAEYEANRDELPFGLDTNSAIELQAFKIALASLDADAGSNSHPAHGPLSNDRLHRIREILGKAAAQSDGGNIGYAMSDAVKAIDELLAGRKSEPDYIRYDCGCCGWEAIEDWRDNDVCPKCNHKPMGKTELFIAPPAPVVPATLPCSVELKPGLIIGKGCKTETLLTALQRRADYYAEIDAMTPEERAEHDANIEAFKAMLPQPDIEMLSSALRNAPLAPSDSQGRPRTPVVPEKKCDDDGNTTSEFDHGWNACRATMLNHSGDVTEMGEAIKQPSDNASSLVFVDEIAEQNGVDPAITDAYMQGYHDSEVRKSSPVANDDLREAVSDLLAALDEYPEQLVPINRKSFLVRTIRAAMLQGDKNNG